MREFAKGQGLTLDRNTKQVATRNGNFVYMGQTADAAGGKGFTRDRYLFVDDAKASLWNMPRKDIAAIQKKLGVLETGIPEGDIKQLWDYAVEQAAQGAIAGVKVSPEFIFNTMVASIAAKRAGGGGGGGGVRREAHDYYFDMMQVLGDISGVEG
jgi:hypothetical protein